MIYKYFTLFLDYLLAISYQLTTQNWSFFACLPPLLHTFIFVVTPHCHVGHCQPDPDKKCLVLAPQQHEVCKKQVVKVNQSDAFLTGIVDYLSPLRHQQSQKKQHLLQNPSPTAFTVRSHQALHQPQAQAYKKCKECGLTTWVRMQHCYYCGICVHKYDHHCLLLGVCIGEANQKYYLPYLYAFFISSLMELIGYYSVIGEEVSIDENGIQKISIKYVGMSLAMILYVGSVAVVGNLAFYHTYLALYNETTYEMSKRGTITYFRGIINQHPFHNGIFNNIKQIFGVRASQPYRWDRPNNFGGGSVGKRESRQSENVKMNVFQELDQTFTMGKQRMQNK